MRIAGIERDGALAALAADNARANGFADRLAILVADIRAVPGWSPGSFDWAIANPPFLEAARADASPEPRRRAATVEGEATLADWVRAMLLLVRPKGSLALIQRADRLADLLQALRGDAGEVVVFPLWPRAGEPRPPRAGARAQGHRRAAASRRRPGAARRRRPVTPAAEAILRDGAALSALAYD